MPTTYSPQVHRLADVHPDAILGQNVTVGPFCRIGSQVRLGDGCRLDSNVVIYGDTTIGERNRFWPGAVIGGEPQDISFREDAPVSIVIGDDNVFREGVTVHRGAEKEDGVTRIGDGNMFMANSHIAHNCVIGNKTYLVNGVLLGGHVHVEDAAIVSGNSVVHHFSTLGRLSFVSGGCRVPHDVPPFMLSAGSDNPTIRTINIVGMKRAGIPLESIRAVKSAFRLLYREHKPLATARDIMMEETGGVLPLELSELWNFLERTQAGRMGRGREGGQTVTPNTKSANTPVTNTETDHRDAA